MPDWKPDVTLGDLLGVGASLLLACVGWLFGRIVVSAERKRQLTRTLHAQVVRQLRVTTPDNELNASPDWAELVSLQRWWHRRRWRRAFGRYRTACSARADNGRGEVSYADAHAVQAALKQLQRLSHFDTL